MLKALLSNIIILIKNNKTLTLILIIASLLRFVGTNPGYNQYHSDQGISYSAATSMIKNGNFDPLRYDYPSLVPDINYIFFKLFFIPLSWARFYITHIPEIIDGLVHIPIAPLEKQKLFQTYVLGEREINAIFWSRYVTALFGLGCVFLTYLVSKRLFKDGGQRGTVIGLIAAFLLTFNYKHVTNSHFGLPDIYNAFFLLLSLLATINLWRAPSFKNYIFAGIAIGLSFSVKYQVFAVFPFLLVHIYLSISKGKLDIKRLFNPAFFLSLLMVPIVFAITNPYFFIHWEKAIKSVKDVSQKYGMGTSRINLYPFWYMYTIDYGAIQAIAILAGILIATKRFIKESLIFLSFLMPFAFIFLYYSAGGFYIRNFITITPFVIIYAAFALWYLFDLLQKSRLRKMSKVILAVILVISVLIPGKNSIINSYYYTKPWGYDVLREWSHNIPKDAIVAAHPFEISKGTIKNKRTEFEISGSYSLAEHRENGANYALMNLDWAGNSFYFWMNFGLKDLKDYWYKPTVIMRDTFHGLASEELFRYQVFSTSKPWQAPDSALILSKLPVWPNVKYNQINTYNFDRDDQGWKIYNGHDNEYRFDSEEGKSQKGSILFQAYGSRAVRITSPLINVKSGHLYKITGFLITQKLLTSKERDGFLRVDFYGEKPDLDKMGLISSLSSRVYGTQEWVEKEVTERAPDNAKFLTVSFAVYQPNKTRLWLDDVTIRESKETVEDITARSPYIKKEIDLNLLYPNSHGNL